MTRALPSGDSIMMRIGPVSPLLLLLTLAMRLLVRRR